LDGIGRFVVQDRAAASCAQADGGRKYQRKHGAGRKPMPARQIFSAIVDVP